MASLVVDERKMRADRPLELERETHSGLLGGPAAEHDPPHRIRRAPQLDVGEMSLFLHRAEIRSQGATRLDQDRLGSEVASRAQTADDQVDELMDLQDQRVMPAHEMLDRAQAADIAVAIKFGDADLIGELPDILLAAMMKMQKRTQGKQMVVSRDHPVEVLTGDDLQINQGQDIARTGGGPGRIAQQLDITQTTRIALEIGLHQKDAGPGLSPALG